MRNVLLLIAAAMFLSVLPTPTGAQPVNPDADCEDGRGISVDPEDDGVALLCLSYPECPPGSAQQFPACASDVCADPALPMLDLACALAAACGDAAGAADAQACVDELAALIPLCAPGQTPVVNGCVLPSQASCALDFEPMDCPAQACALDGALGPACAVVAACSNAPADEGAACIAALAGLAPRACEEGEEPSPGAGCAVPHEVACLIESQSPECAEDPCADPSEPFALACAVLESCPDADAFGADCLQFVGDTVTAFLGPPCDTATVEGTCILPAEAACLFDYNPSDCSSTNPCPGSQEPVMAVCALVATCPDAEAMGAACLDALAGLLPDPCEAAENPDTGECLVPEDVVCILEGGDCAPDPCANPRPELAPACLAVEACSDEPAGESCLAILGSLLPRPCEDGEDPEETGCFEAAPPECDEFPPEVEGPEDRCLPTEGQATAFAASLRDGVTVDVCAAIAPTPAWAVLVEGSVCPNIEAEPVILFEPDAAGEESEAVVVVRLNVVPSAPVTLTLTLPAAAAGELQVDATELVIDPEDDCDEETGCEAAFTATALDDAIDDPDAVLSIAIQAAQEDGGLYDGLEVDPIQVTVKDDELPVLALRPGAFGAEQGQVAGKFRFERTSQDMAAALGVCFDVVAPASTASVDGTNRDLTGIPAIQSAGACSGHRAFTIPAGAASGELTLFTVDDTEIEETELLVLRLSALPAYEILRSSATIEVADNDLPVVSIAASDSRAGEQDRDPGRFTIARTGRVDAPLTVLFTVSGTAQASDYERTPAAGEITIPAGARSATVVVTPTDDAAVESTESILVTLSGNEALYFRDSVFQASVLILDNDGENAPQPVNPISDRDGDGVRNVDDNCPDARNPDQSNQDGDLLGDECDPTPTPPELPTDDGGEGGDGNGTDGEGGGEILPADADADGLTDEEEDALGTDPGRGDSDGDGLSDKRELDLGTDPMGRDSDGDGVNDGAEVLGVRNQGLPTDPLDPTDTTAAEGFATRPAFYVGVALTMGIVAALAIGIMGFASRRP